MTERRSFFDKLTGRGREIELDATDSEEQIIELSEEDDTDGDIIEPIRTERETESIPLPPDEQEGQLTVDVYQTPDAIVIKSTIAGVKPDDLDVSITNDMVTIRGTRRHDEEVKEDEYFYRECYWGSFSRSIILPVDVVSDKSEASLKDGILTIRIPKADALVTKKVKVRGF